MWNLLWQDTGHSPQLSSLNPLLLSCRCLCNTASYWGISLGITAPTQQVPAVRGEAGGAELVLSLGGLGIQALWCSPCRQQCLELPITAVVMEEGGGALQNRGCSNTCREQLSPGALQGPARPGEQPFALIRALSCGSSPQNCFA